jgi:signal transduction histidine kinase
VLQLAGAGQTELRALLTDIRSDRLPSGELTAALESLAADARTRNGLDIPLSLGGRATRARRDQGSLVMIGREALHNVVKHGGADRVDIVLEASPGGLVLLITDDGRGLTPRRRGRATSDCKRCVNARPLSAARLA